jgi:hypothetical protein
LRLCDTAARIGSDELGAQRSHTVETKIIKTAYAAMDEKA